MEKCPFCGSPCYGNTYHVVYACGSINHIVPSSLDQRGWVRSSKCYEAEITALKERINEYEGIKDQLNWQSEQNAQAIGERDEEVVALRSLVRELLNEFIDSTTRKLIIANRPEVRVIMEEVEGG
jgi:hypothetical protein